MIDLNSEKLLTLEQAAEKLLVSKASLYRWITQGYQGVKLEAIKLGVNWRTSEEALQRFGDRLTPNQELPDANPHRWRTSAKREKEQELILEELDELFGIRKCSKCRKVIDPGNVPIPKDEKLWCPECLIQRKSATIGKRIRTFRWAAQMSQAALAKSTGICVAMIRDYEGDYKQPTDAHQAKLMAVLGSSLVSGLDG